MFEFWFVIKIVRPLNGSNIPQIWHWHIVCHFVKVGQYLCFASKQTLHCSEGRILIKMFPCPLLQKLSSRVSKLCPLFKHVHCNSFNGRHEKSFKSILFDFDLWIKTGQTPLYGCVKVASDILYRNLIKAGSRR